MSEHKVHQFRGVSDDTAIWDVDPNVLIEHRHIIHNQTPEERAYFDQHILVDALSPEEVSHLAEYFPNYKKALWVYEKGKANKISLQSARVFYRSHVRLQYRTDLSAEVQTVILKKTSYGKMEHVMSRLAQRIGLSSYRVLPVQGSEDGGAHWRLMNTGLASPRVVFIPAAYSSYAVIEQIAGIPLEELKSSLSSLSHEQQSRLFYELGLQLGYEFLFGCRDEKLEHYIVNTKTLALTRIDKQDSLSRFSYTPVDLEFYSQLFRTSIPKQESLGQLQNGMASFYHMIDRKWKLITSCLEQSIKHGIMNESRGNGVLEPKLISELETQKQRLQKFVESFGW